MVSVGELPGQGGDQLSVNRTPAGFDPFYNVDPLARAFFIPNPPESTRGELDRRKYGQPLDITNSELVSARKLDRQSFEELARILPDYRPDLYVDLNRFPGGRIMFFIEAVNRRRVDPLFHPDNSIYTADQLKSAVGATRRAWEKRKERGAIDLAKVYDMVRSGLL